MSADSVAQDQLRAFVERVERLDEELKAINEDKREIYAEAKGNGFDVPALKQVLKLRRMDHNERMERDAIVDLYMSALGMATYPTEFEEDAALARAGARAPARTRGGVTEPRTAAMAQPQGQLDQSVAPVTAEGQADGIAAPHIIPAGTPPQSTPAGERSGEGHPVAPLDNSAAQTASLSPNGANGANAGGENVIASDDPRTDIEPENTLNSRADAAGFGSAVEIGARSPGDTWLERCPLAPVRWHEFSRCFPELWGPGRAELSDDIRANGVTHPIVKIGDEVLDGRARYTIARELGMEYPVTEYAGADPLADVIRWNLASRQLSTNERKAIATKLMKLPNVAHRASEIAQLFGLETEEAA